MKIMSIVLLTVLAFAVSIYLAVSEIVIEETQYGAREVVLFSIPLTMLLVNSNLFIIPKLIQKKGSYDRLKKGFESIFLSISIILFLLHGGLLFVSTGTEINLLLFVPLSVGLVLITTANTLPRFQIDLDEDTSPQTSKLWNTVIRPFSLPLFIGGILMLFSILLPEPLMMIVFFTILFLTILASVVRSYRAYQS
ncbi:hypothetical protein ACDX78_03830 [Virgibacillus oceani]